MIVFSCDVLYIEYSFFEEPMWDMAYSSVFVGDAVWSACVRHCVAIFGDHQRELTSEPFVASPVSLLGSHAAFHWGKPMFKFGGSNV